MKHIIAQTLEGLRLMLIAVGVLALMTLLLAYWLAELSGGGR